MPKSRAEINKDRYERTKAGLVKLKPYITLAQEDKFLSVLRGESKIVPATKKKDKV